MPIQPMETTLKAFRSFNALRSAAGVVVRPMQIAANIAKAATMMTGGVVNVTHAVTSVGPAAVTLGLQACVVGGVLVATQVAREAVREWGVKKRLRAHALESRWDADLDEDGDPRESPEEWGDGPEEQAVIMDPSGGASYGRASNAAAYKSRRRRAALYYWTRKAIAQFPLRANNNAFRATVFKWTHNELKRCGWKEKHAFSYAWRVVAHMMTGTEEELACRELEEVGRPTWIQRMLGTGRRPMFEK